MQKNFRGNEYRNTVVTIDSYRDDVLHGTVSNPYFDAPQPFTSATQFIRILEDAFDDMKFPQAYTAIRTFSRNDGLVEPSAQPKQGGIATFYVRVLFRQNSSWQGEVTWAEGKTSEAFRSTMELLLLMDSALRSN